MKAIFLDIETTGCDFFKHVPIEIAIVIVDYNANKNKSVFCSSISCSANDWENADSRSLKYVGVNPECVWLGQTIENVSKEIEFFLLRNDISKDNSFFICQNPSFDRNFFHRILTQERMTILNLPYHWLDLASMYWIKYQSKNSYKPTINLSKDTIAKKFKIPPEKKPHRALNGVEHLIKCYEALL